MNKNVQLKSIDILNSLIGINNDRIEGYETASKETKDWDLKRMFSRFSQTSQKCKLEIVIEVLKLNGCPKEGARTTGQFYRVCMDANDASTYSRKSILISCDHGECVAIENYEKVLIMHLEDLTSEQKILIMAQHILLKTDHNLIRGMRHLVTDLDLVSKN